MKNTKLPKNVTDLIGQMHASADSIDHIARTWPAYRDAMLNHAPGVSAAVGGSRSGGGISDPTGNAVIASEIIEDGKPADEARHLGWKRDPITAELIYMENLIKRINGDVAKVVRSVNRVTSPKVPDARDKPVTCRQIGCDEVIETRLSEYALTRDCPACHRWLANNNNASTVPARVLADRRRQREHRDRQAQVV